MNGQQGYIVTGTNTTDLTSIPTSTTTPLASITLSYGVWFITGQAAIYNSAAASAVMSNKQFGITTSTTALEGKYINRAVGSSTLGIGVAAYENVTRVVTVTNSSTTYNLLTFINYSSGTLQTWSNNTNLYAVRLA